MACVAVQPTLSLQTAYTSHRPQGTKAGLCGLPGGPTASLPPPGTGIKSSKFPRRLSGQLRRLGNAWLTGPQWPAGLCASKLRPPLDFPAMSEQLPVSCLTQVVSWSSRVGEGFITHSPNQTPPTRNTGVTGTPSLTNAEQEPYH